MRPALCPTSAPHAPRPLLCPIGSHPPEHMQHAELQGSSVSSWAPEEFLTCRELTPPGLHLHREAFAWEYRGLIVCMYFKGRADGIFRNRNKCFVYVCVGKHRASQEIGKIMYK